MVSKEIIGKVISNKMNKTIIVAVNSKIAHKKYNKTLKNTRASEKRKTKNTCHKTGPLHQLHMIFPFSISGSDDGNKALPVISVISGLDLLLLP